MENIKNYQQTCCLQQLVISL